jgi:hypothetical protein
MRITIEVKETNALFLKEELGTGSIGGEPISFGVGVPNGTPYVHLRGVYYQALDMYPTMLRAVHEQEGCDGEAKDD